MTHYNPWPLGKIPEEWQRPEPRLIKELGYSWQDPRDIVDIFEEKLATYSGARYCVLTDCLTSAFFLSLKYRNYVGPVTIPENTYVSIPMHLIHAGCSVIFSEEKWTGIYKMDAVNIVDGAGRFRKGMYVGGDSLHLLSFQIKKRLPIGRGGAILTDSKEAWQWLKLASYDGRDLNSPYTAAGHVKNLGWHFYMTPEDAARGILIMDQLGDNLDDILSWENYPKLSDYDINFN